MNNYELWKERFFQDYLAEDGRTYGKALRLKEKNLPPSLFRYRSWNECTLEEIRSDTIFLSPLDGFNDIFDSWVGCSLDGLTGVSRMMAGNMMPNPGLFKKELNRIIDTIDPKQKFKSMLFDLGGKEPESRFETLALETDKNAAELEENLNRIIRTMARIACFTTKPVNMPMWYHYAKGGAVPAGTGTGMDTSNDYAGLCLEYDMTQADRIPAVIENILPVNYQSRMPDMMMILKEHPSQVRRYAATLKNKDWSYEDEWRLILSLGDFYRSPEEIPEEVWTDGIKYQFLPVKAVYMGDQVKPENREMLKKAAGEKGFALYQMKAVRGRYVPENVC